MNNGRIVSVSDGKTVRVWEASSGICTRNFEGHTKVYILTLI